MVADERAKRTRRPSQLLDDEWCLQEDDEEEEHSPFKRARRSGPKQAGSSQQAGSWQRPTAAAVGVGPLEPSNDEVKRRRLATEEAACLLEQLVAEQVPVAASGGSRDSGDGCSGGGAQPGRVQRGGGQRRGPQRRCGGTESQSRQGVLDHRTQHPLQLQRAHAQAAGEYLAGTS